MQRNKRRRQLIDHKVQGMLCLRAFFYWLFCVISLCLVALVWRIFTDPATLFESSTEHMLERFLPVVVGALLLVPVLLVDCLALSNRFAGPIYRLRGAMRELAEGRLVGPIHFRQGDYWCELADDFNRIAERVANLEQRAAQQDESPSEPGGHGGPTDDWSADGSKLEPRCVATLD